MQHKSTSEEWAKKREGNKDNVKPESPLLPGHKPGVYAPRQNIWACCGWAAICFFPDFWYPSLPAYMSVDTWLFSLLPCPFNASSTLQQKWSHNTSRTNHFPPENLRQLPIAFRMETKLHHALEVLYGLRFNFHAFLPTSLATLLLAIYQLFVQRSLSVTFSEKFLPYSLCLKSVPV